VIGVQNTEWVSEKEERDNYRTVKMMQENERQQK
jgi:hypothetical protein